MMSAKNGNSKLDEIRGQLESIFRGFYIGYDVVAVCCVALKNQAADQDLMIANVLNSVALVRTDYHLRRFAKLIKSIGGSTAYDDDEEEGWEDGYQEVKAEDNAVGESNANGDEEHGDDNQVDAGSGIAGA